MASDCDIRVCVIHGMFGVGKTQLALEIACQWEGPVFWLNAETPLNLKESFDEIARILRLDVEPGMHGKDLGNLAKQWLATHNGWLLVYDNTKSFEAMAERRAYISLPPWTAYSSKAFLKESLEHHEVNDDDLGRISTLLGGLPLALAHVVECIKKQADDLTDVNDIINALNGCSDSFTDVWSIDHWRNSKNPLSWPYERLPREALDQALFDLDPSALPRLGALVILDLPTPLTMWPQETRAKLKSLDETMKSEKETPTGFGSPTSKADITNKVKEICNITGIVGMSAAVIHEGEVVWKESIGYRNLEEKSKATSYTLFPIGALSQSFTAAVVAQMSHRNILRYDDKISQHPRNFLDLDAEAPDNTTIADLLGHRTGLQAAESIMTEYGGRVSLLQDEILRAYYSLKRLAEPRSQFIHGAINYTLLGEIVHRYCPEGYNLYLIKNILKPLGMSATGNIYLNRGYDHLHSKLYHVGRRGEQLLSQRVDCLDTVLAPDLPDLKSREAFRIHDFESLRSYCKQKHLKRLDCLLTRRSDMTEKDSRDILKLDIYRRQQATAEEIISLRKATMPNAARGLNMAADKKWDPAPDDRGCKRAFPNVDLLFSPLQSMKGASNEETIKSTCSYAAGWATTTLPGRLEGLGANSKLIPMPMIGLGQSKASKVYWNQGVHCGSNCFVALLPETKSAVIVLTNTRTANDAADWIGQLLLQTLLGGDLNLFSVQTSIANAHKQHEHLVNSFNFVKGKDFWASCSRPLGQYMGVYESSADSGKTLIVWPETYEGVKPFVDKTPSKEEKKKIRTFGTDKRKILPS
ncbi:hypothetical protein MKX08_006089 [Trichoderma sp. CBMAI-0020]|nr:hypothetical protein MKX08_006089 [Trichoderma sp. CBMAI-0020]